MCNIHGVFGTVSIHALYVVAATPLLSPHLAVCHSIPATPRLQPLISCLSRHFAFSGRTDRLQQMLADQVPRDQ